MGFGRQQPVAARDGVAAQPGPGKVERHPLPGLGGMGLDILRMDRAHPRLDAAGRDQKPVARFHRARKRRAGNHEARAAQGEAAVHRQPEPPRRPPPPDRARKALQQTPQVRHALARYRGDGQDRRPG